MVSAAAPQRHVTLDNETDFDGFRAAARSLLLGGCSPDSVQWSVAGSATPGLFGDAAPTAPEGGAEVAAAGAALLRVPADFIALCRHVLLHRDGARFTLLFRLLWRIGREPLLRHDPLDSDMAQARLMAQAVRRDLHKMKAFVRFRPVAQAGGAGLLHVAWFEPEHHIVDAVAPFFVRRFTALRWAILTPRRSLRWDGEQLHLAAGAARDQAPPADAGEALWLTYYESIFNPARLKLRAMEKEMPRKYWHNLPEAALISSLSAQAQTRSGQMLERPAALPRRRVVPLVPLVRMPRQPLDAAQRGAGGLPSSGSAEQRQQVWADQRSAAAACQSCPLGALATQTVWGEGAIDASLMLVGEQPGDQEDLHGRPFVGPAGQLLDRAMAQLGWDRSTVYVTNCVKHFKYEPRGKRRMHKTPAQKEADACQHWLEAEIALVQPQALVALGATAARQLLGRPVAVLSERGQWLRRLDGRAVFVTLHPAALLRMPAEHRDAGFADWVAELALAAR